MKDLFEDINEIESSIGYEFKNKDLLAQAFTRKSYSEENGGENNEILEFIGDRVLDYFVTKIIITKYGQMDSQIYELEADDADEFSVKKYSDEGKLTNLKKKLVNKHMLASRIKSLQLEEYLYLGQGDINKNIQEQESVKEDLFEAIIGAVAIDSNWNTKACEEAIKFMLNIDYYLDNGFDKDNDYVTLIQEWSQKEYGEIPYYEFSQDIFGPIIATLNLCIDGTNYHQFIGRANNKCDARMVAAKNAYEYLDSNNLLWTIMDELPENVDCENAINVLQELSQKGYISMPEYFPSESQKYNKNGDLVWECICILESENIRYEAWATSKKEAKKYSAYLCLCELCNLENIYEDHNEDDE